jgi:hypothetical protein
MSTDIEKAQELLARLAQQQFFGTVSFQFKRGDIILIRQESTMVPADLTSGRTDRDKLHR